MAQSDVLQWIWGHHSNIRDVIHKICYCHNCQCIMSFDKVGPVVQKATDLYAEPSNQIKSKYDDIEITRGLGTEYT